MPGKWWVFSTSANNNHDNNVFQGARLGQCVLPLVTECHGSAHILTHFLQFMVLPLVVCDAVMIGTGMVMLGVIHSTACMSSFIQFYWNWWWWWWWQYDDGCSNGHLGMTNITEAEALVQSLHHWYLHLSFLRMLPVDVQQICWLTCFAVSPFLAFLPCWSILPPCPPLVLRCPAGLHVGPGDGPAPFARRAIHLLVAIWFSCQGTCLRTVGRRLETYRVWPFVALFSMWPTSF